VSDGFLSQYHVLEVGAGFTRARCSSSSRSWTGKLFALDPTLGALREHPRFVALVEHE